MGGLVVLLRVAMPPKKRPEELLGASANRRWQAPERPFGGCRGAGVGCWLRALGTRLGAVRGCRRELTGAIDCIPRPIEFAVSKSSQREVGHPRTSTTCGRHPPVK